MSQLNVNAEQLVSLIAHGNWTDASLKRFAEAIRYRRSQMTYEVRRSLSIGDTVKFHSTKLNMSIVGQVSKVAIKYVTVDTARGRWKVPASMLEMA